MLDTLYDSEDTIMHVPYPPKPPSNLGYVECRGLPDRAAAISEAAGSALRDLLIDLAQPNAQYFSIGCDLDQHEEDGKWVAGGYVQIALAAWRLPVRCEGDTVIFMFSEFPQDIGGQLRYYVTELGEKIAQSMEAKSEEHDWRLKIVRHRIVLAEKASPEWLEYVIEIGEELESATSAMTGALIIRFEADAETEALAVASREIMINTLAGVLTEDSYLVD